MQTIKIKTIGYDINGVYSVVNVSELRRVISEHPEILKEEKKSFGERMIGKKYWYIMETGNKDDSIWKNDGIDRIRLSINNIFFTESDCDKEIARKLALGRILAYIRDNEIELVKDEDWKNRKLKFTIIGWDYDNEEVAEAVWETVNDSKHSLAFYSQEDREKVVSNCGKDLEVLLKK